MALAVRLATRILALFGWRGALGAALGAVIAAMPAYHAGKWTEGAASESRVEAALAARDLKVMEAENDRIDAARRARLRSDRRSRDASASGGMPNDGFRRD